MAELDRPRSRRPPWASLVSIGLWAVLSAGCARRVGSDAPAGPPLAPRPLDRAGVHGSRGPVTEPTAQGGASLGRVEKKGQAVVRLLPSHLELERRGARDFLRIPSALPGSLMVALDEHRPRSLAAKTSEIALKKLLPEDLELAPGGHNLIMCGRDAGALDCSVLTFALETGGEPRRLPDDARPCFLLEPGGTYWGESPVPLLAIALADDGSPSPVSYRLTHALGEMTVSSQSGENVEVTLPPGDTLVELRCSLSPEISIKRTITVNPEPPQ